MQGPGDGGEGSLQQPGDVPEVQALVPETDSLLQLLWIERPPLGAAITKSIPQRGHTACAVKGGQPFVSGAEADTCFCSQLWQRPVLIQVLRNQSQQASLRQAGIGVCMHGA